MTLPSSVSFLPALPVKGFSRLDQTGPSDSDLDRSLIESRNSACLVLFTQALADAMADVPEPA